jgi:hypothetical protein
VWVASRSGGRLLLDVRVTAENQRTARESDDIGFDTGQQLQVALTHSFASAQDLDVSQGVARLASLGE